MKTKNLKDYGLCTLHEAAKAKRCTVRTVRRWVAAGEILHVSFGEGRHRVCLIDLAALRDYAPPQRGRPLREQPK